MITLSLFILAPFEDLKALRNNFPMESNGKYDVYFGDAAQSINHIVKLQNSQRRYYPTVFERTED